MSVFPFCLSSHSEFFTDWPDYIDFILSLSAESKTYSYGTFLRLEFLLSQLEITERQRDEAICEVLGYALPPQSYEGFSFFIDTISLDITSSLLPVQDVTHYWLASNGVLRR